MTAVSVVLPVFNGEASLPLAIESILTQDIDDWELILIDDASSDSSADVIRRYASRDPRISPIYHTENLGLTVSLNEGIAAARSNLVARMDADDESLPSRLRIQRDFMDANPQVAVAGSWVYNMGASRAFDRLVRLPTSPIEVAETLPRENCIYHPSVMLRRDVVVAAGGYRTEFSNAQDYDLWLRLSRQHALANIPEALLRYRFSVDGLTLGRKWEQVFEIHLAQAAASDPSISIEQASQRARETLAAVDRTRFLMDVALWNVRELVALRLWRDAVAVATRFHKEIGFRASVSLLARIGRVRIIGGEIA